MAGSRLELQAKLEQILGSTNVYFQPPPSVKLKFPCIVYKKTGQDEVFADDILYSNMRKYSVTVIDPNPDSAIPDRLQRELRYCSFSTNYPADNLNHDVYTLYF